MTDTAFKKKLYVPPKGELPRVEVQASCRRLARPSCDNRTIEEGVRQRLADKISGTMVGLWLLVPEHLRLGTWDLLRGWSKRPTDCLEPFLCTADREEVQMLTQEYPQRWRIEEFFNTSQDLGWHRGGT